MSEEPFNSGQQDFEVAPTETNLIAAGIKYDFRIDTRIRRASSRLTVEKVMKTNKISDLVDRYLKSVQLLAWRAN